MQHSTTAAFAATFITTLIFTLPKPTVDAHNITTILSHFPEFSTFNHYLTITHLANEINNRQTITVCAVNNAAMSHYLHKHLSIPAMKKVLSLHVLLDYFGAKKLHQMTHGTSLTATMFQATGSASGTSGMVNITDLKGGKVGFRSDHDYTVDDDKMKPDALFVKSLKEIAYNISVIQINNMLPSTEAEAEAPASEVSDVNITSLMSAHGCKHFADALLASDAINTFGDNINGGLTVFCPIDKVFKSFLPKFKNLTVDGKQSLLEYHGVPIYESMTMLKSSNGLMNTLATDGGSKYDFEVQNDGQDVTLKTRVVTAKIVGTLIDQQPLVIFTIDKVLLPKELFKKSISPAPAPRSPKAPPAPASLDSPADSPDDASADEAADINNAVGIKGIRFVAIMGLSFWSGYLVM